MNSKKTRDDRTRNWSFILYPESAPKNWKEILEEEHIQWICSPLHDKDLNADNQPKKPHWHILLMYEGNKSFEQIKSLTDSLCSPNPQKVSSVKGLVRYMIHLDNPEKAQYNKKEIIGYGGIDVEEYLKPTSASRYQLIAEMRLWVEENNCKEFFTLFDYASLKRFDDWFPLLCDNSAYILGEYIKSRRNSLGTKRTNKEVYMIDKETGEIIE